MEQLIISDLGYAVCKFMARLDEAFAGQLDWWRIREGFAIKFIEDGDKFLARTEIHPYAWKEEDNIVIRFQYISEHRIWLPFEGSINTRELSSGRCQLNFKIAGNYINPLDDHENESREASLLRQYDPW